ncbi:sialate O-acetylesterase [Mucilaginibacter gynuensis]|uniref:Sialate O-acetylesterase n=1 Tax=Mucilaginibacter gynuensis TaxID=1302236 RepID=A0ABP8H9B3_9SPHI
MGIKNLLIKSVKQVLLSALLFTGIKPAEAKVALPACLTDDMVLQQKAQVNLWGKATAGKPLTITTSWNNKKYTATADAKGDWKIKVATPSFGGPYTISFNDGEALTLKNILIGEVWVCSGQSNMEMWVSGMYGDVLNAQQEIAAANYPEIRMIKVDNTISMQPLTELKTKWSWRACSPQTVAQFSAVAYFFAKNLYEDKHVPIGIINTTWGGTVAEAWTSGEALKTMPAYAPAVKYFESGITQEKLNKEYDSKLAAWTSEINAKDQIDAQGSAPWAKSTFDVSAWKKMPAPGLWEKGSLPNFDGIVKFVKKVTIPAAWAGKDVVLSLGSIDDNDITWFNGTQIGHTDGVFVQRKYTIPGNLVKAGENTIAIRVFDTGGDGGFNGGPITISLASNADEKVDLAGEWSYLVGSKLSELPAAPQRPDGPNRPTLLYNAMVNPIINYTIKGVIWYQGESNANKADQYSTLFPLMISDWRKQWGQGNFPFYFVQLANFMAQDAQPVESEWAELREAQLKTLSVPNTGMASAIDIGDAYNIHPTNKQEVGRRLALIAKAKNYGEKVAYSGPIYKAQTVKGNTIELTFTYADGGLKVKGDKLSGFAIAGADKKFYWADAKLEGNKVIVSSAQVSNPAAVRYGWGNNPTCTLYNVADLPATPFRTDTWPGITVGKE